eukprot:UN01073
MSLPLYCLKYLIQSGYSIAISNHEITGHDVDVCDTYPRTHYWWSGAGSTQTWQVTALYGLTNFEFSWVGGDSYGGSNVNGLTFRVEKELGNVTPFFVVIT